MARLIRLGAALIVAVATLTAISGEAQAIVTGPDLTIVGGSAAVSNGLSDHLESCTTGSVDRVGGADRYATAALLSQQMSGADTVFLATGSKFPDAITAGSVGALANAPILLTAKDSIPAPTNSALNRIGPSRVVILGGTSVIAASVEDGLASRFDEVVRIGGADRFETAAALSQWYFATAEEVDTVYVANGTSYVDSMVAGPAATRDGSPVLLTDADALPDATAGEITRLAPRNVIIVGSVSAVGSVVESAIEDLGATVSRIAGSSRWGTAANAAKASPASSKIFVVTGNDFPDGLAAIPVAKGAPIVLVGAEELHAVTADAIAQRTQTGCEPWTPPYPQVGSGKRVIYTLSGHQIWMIDENDRLVDTYPVTGRRGIPHPGTYSVFSKSVNAWAPYGGITMKHMVRFVRPGTWGNQWSYGFHSIPNYSNGTPMQTEAELGSYGSGGCIRQANAKAAVMFDWADIGTTVIVLP